jgi:hypothetical protein
VGEASMSRHIIKYYCEKCEQYKPVFKTDEKGNKMCPEEGCGNKLVQKRLDI